MRVQWDPERSLLMKPLAHRAIQIGIGAEVLGHYVENWNTDITDVTKPVQEIHRLIVAGRLEAAESRLPTERPYPLPASLGATLGVD